MNPNEKCMTSHVIAFYIMHTKLIEIPNEVLQQPWGWETHCYMKNQLN